VIGTAHVLEAIRLLKKPCAVVLITTDKVYENKEWVHPYRETDALGGYDPYSASKACAELLINSYVQSFFNAERFNTHSKAIAVARAGNVIGGGDWAKDRIVPDIIRALSSNQPVIVRNPTSVRPWQHVLEPLGGYLLLGGRLFEDPESFSGAWNFGPFVEDNIAVETLVRNALQLWGNGTYKNESAPDQPHEAHFLRLDISKALNYLQWKPKLNSSEAIELTIAWYRQYKKDRRLVKEFTINQINSYMADKPLK
jgi:CDP-glucose 4,6-dehydratase